MNFSLWFTLRAAPFSSLEQKILIGIFLGLLLFALVSWFIRKKNKSNRLRSRVFEKFFYWGLTWGLVGFIGLFFNIEGIPLLGSRFWFLFFFLGALVWLGFILYYLFYKMPGQKRELIKKKEFEKYLP